MLGDKAYISALDVKAILENCGVRVIAQPRTNMQPKKSHGGSSHCSSNVIEDDQLSTRG